MRLLLPILLVLLTSCIPFNINSPDDESTYDVPGRGRTLLSLSAAVKVDLISITANKSADLGDESELYLIYGLKKSRGAEIADNLPSSDYVSVFQGRKLEMNWMLYQGRVNLRELVAMNLVVMEEDCGGLDRAAFAKTLIPDAVEYVPLFDSGDRTEGILRSRASEGRLGVRGVGWSRLLLSAISETTSLVCQTNEDDYLGSLFLQFRNDSSGLQWTPQCRNACQIVEADDQRLVIKVDAEGEYLIELGITMQKYGR